MWSQKNSTDYNSLPYLLTYRNYLYVVLFYAPYFHVSSLQQRTNDCLLTVLGFI